MSKVSTIMSETGKDPFIYFDTEAANFAHHLVEIISVTNTGIIVDDETMIVLQCDKKNFKHIETT